MGCLCSRIFNIFPQPILSVMRRNLTIFLAMLCWLTQAQPNANVVVDANGVMKWGTKGPEVKGFGVNYTTAYAHAYRTAKKRGISLEKAIDDDVYHFARLGFDFFRVHVWDTEISDSLGNLLNNDHLKMFDYTLAKMKERGFHFLITPIAFWGNGWPEPDDKTPGFSRKYGKDACLTNPDAIRAQQNYLAQFVKHVNPFTGIAYQDDPSFIGFEVSNEPHHREAPEKVEAYITGMVDAMRKAGCKKLIFYNVSHGINYAETYAASKIQGGTFQWYPTGLGSQHELGGNLLPNVDLYAVPFTGSPAWKKLAKVVYEFDAADVGRSYIYPAMARSFREAGMQVASHFAYDPTYMADVNTEYGTHYMNLVYAPQKALSLKLASEVFHRVPMNKSYGRYPANTRFDSFRVDYESDLAEMITDKEFYHTNSTATTPPAPASLEHIAGSGNSPLVQYDGTGAYFLDRLASGIWRLEVMPDVVWTSDPFAPASPKKKVAVIQWRQLPMTIKLADLGESFRLSPMNSENSFSADASSGTVQVRPGAYVLVKSGLSSTFKPDDKMGTIRLGEFAAPAATVDKQYVLHKPVAEVSEGSPLEVTATIIGPNEPASAELRVLGQGRRGSESIPMKKGFGYQYAATAPAGQNYIRYYIVVRTGNERRTFPADVDGEPRDWDFDWRKTYDVPVIPRGAPLYLFESTTDANDLSRTWLPGAGNVPTGQAGMAELVIPVQQLVVTDNENPNGVRVADYSMRFFFGQKISGRRGELSGRQQLVVSGRGLNDNPCLLQIALITKSGQAFGAIVTLPATQSEVTIPIADLKAVKLVTLPRPYPTFLSYYFEGSMPPTLNIIDIETLQISIGPGLSDEELKKPQGVVLRSVRLQ